MLIHFLLLEPRRGPDINDESDITGKVSSSICTRLGSSTSVSRVLRGSQSLSGSQSHNRGRVLVAASLYCPSVAFRVAEATKSRHGKCGEAAVSSGCVPSCQCHEQMAPSFCICGGRPWPYNTPKNAFKPSRCVQRWAIIPLWAGRRLCLSLPLLWRTRRSASPALFDPCQPAVYLNADLHQTCAGRRPQAREVRSLHKKLISSVRKESKLLLHSHILL